MFWLNSPRYQTLLFWDLIRGLTICLFVFLRYDLSPKSKLQLHIVFSYLFVQMLLLEILNPNLRSLLRSHSILFVYGPHSWLPSVFSFLIIPSFLFLHLKENLVHMYVEYSGTYIINKNAALEKYFFFFNFILDRNNFFGGFLFCKWTNKLYYFLKIAHEYLYIFTATLWICILYTTFFSLDVFLAKTPITATFLDMFGILWALGLFSRG